MTQLGVNIDHVATVRNARGGAEPCPVTAALLAELAGADSIVCHLREDRRHIRDRDVRLLRELVKTSLQLEMATHPDVIRVALEVKPSEIMLVPERRAELTTEGGLDVAGQRETLKAVITRFADAGIGVSVFIDADRAQVDAAKAAGAGTVELHTGPYCHAATETERERELDRLETAAHAAWEAGLCVHAGHGLNYGNIRPLLKRVPVEKVNIGHAIVSRAVFAGLENAVREMKRLVSG
ncbi:MAG: pyridoxine 5'-phosphate synthase [Planctomycetes bacterium]|jgi:pyridoxine 5-phosphate synthase|nr:pyridoxine 5'-phosphate synthase [Planctomycetota bacterium]MCL4729653.1 pyridoxine 5'-phosphate synthase [Planctomycetota bacterium]